jgi:NhaP-type Na+/H+ or K+/H+ antiporter
VGTTVLVLSLMVVAYAVLSRRLESSIVTPPLLFAAAGLILGPHVIGAIHAETSNSAHGFKILIEVTLSVLLFCEAAGLKLRKIFHEAYLPLRLLGIGMPLTMVVGTVLAVALFGEIEFWEAAALAIVLAPTDAALGQVVVSNPRVPGLIRRSLSVESGLNDGLALPFLTIAIALGETEAGADPSGGWLWFTVHTILVSVGLGVAIGFIGGKLLGWAVASNRVAAGPDRLAILAFAIVSFVAVDLLGASGFIGAFVAGATLGATAPSMRSRAEGVAREEGELLVLLVFVLFGAFLVWPAFRALDFEVLAYAVLSLTVIRMLPVAISVVGSRLSLPTVLYLGWFGPRGTASLAFGLLLIAEADLTDQALAVQVVVVTVALSILLHGLSAAPGASAYARAIDRLRVRRPDARELSP